MKKSASTITVNRSVPAPAGNLLQKHLRQRKQQLAAVKKEIFDSSIWNSKFYGNEGNIDC